MGIALFFMGFVCLFDCFSKQGFSDCPRTHSLDQAESPRGFSHLTGEFIYSIFEFTSPVEKLPLFFSTGIRIQLCQTSKVGKRKTSGCPGILTVPGWDYWDIQLCELSSYWVLSLSKCGDGHCWDYPDCILFVSLINSSKVYIHGIDLIPLENSE